MTTPSTRRFKPVRAQLQYRAFHIDASVASRDLVWRCPRDLGVSQMRRCSRTMSNESGCHALRGRNRPTQSDHRVMRSSWLPCEVCSITPPGRATSIPLSAPSRKGQNQRTTVFRRSILSEGVSRHASVYAQPCACRVSDAGIRLTSSRLATRRSSASFVVEVWPSSRSASPHSAQLLVTLGWIEVSERQADKKHSTDNIACRAVEQVMPCLGERERPASENGH
jgi:hypothetical protein